MIMVGSSDLNKYMYLLYWIVYFFIFIEIVEW